MWAGAKRTVEGLGINAYVCEEAMMTAQTNEIQWYIARDGKQHGPLTDVEMRTFVAHNYLRLSDLIWRPGMPEWQSAPTVFPTAFEALGQEPKQASGGSHLPVVQSQPAQYPKTASAQPHDPLSTDFDGETGARPERSFVKRLALASVAITVIGGGAFAFTTYRGTIMDMVAGSSSGGTASTAPVVAAPSADTPAERAAPKRSNRHRASRSIGDGVRYATGRERRHTSASAAGRHDDLVGVFART